MKKPIRFLSLTLLAATPVASGILFTACSSTATHNAPAVTIETPALDASQVATFEGLHNVVAYAPDFVCGGVPEGEHGLATLAAMGIRTIVSVDGASPDVATAERLGMRYVHLPIRYSGVTAERQKQLAQAISSLPGPIYVHCHHGKHRSAAALGSALVLAGKMTPEQVEARMKVSGTAADYQGLWKAVRQAKPLDAAELTADPASFPKVAEASGMVALMSEIDNVFDNLKAARKAAWGPPKNHPDLVPGQESDRLKALFAQLGDDPESRTHAGQPGYQAMLGKSLAASEALDAAVQGNDHAAAETQFVLLEKSCKECHKAHRDN